MTYRLHTVTLPNRITQMVLSETNSRLIINKMKTLIFVLTLTYILTLTLSQAL